MKKNYVLLLISVFVVLSGCKKPVGTEEDVEGYDYLVKIIHYTEGSISKTMNNTDMVNEMATDEFLQPDELDGLTSTDLTDFHSYLSTELSTGNAAAINDYSVDVIHYRTRLPNGKPIIASGIIVTPTAGNVYKGMIIGTHYTMCKSVQAPSVKRFTLEATFASKGFIVSVADYIGLGITANLPHAYLSVENAGRVNIDMARATREYMNHKGINVLTDSVIIAGYSQGGAVALAVQKMIEADEDATHKKEFPIIRTFAGAGPHDLVATYKELVATNHTDYAVGIPMLVLGMDYSESLNLDLTKILSPELNKNYKDWILSKKYTTDQINDKINRKQLDSVLTRDAMDTLKPETKLFYDALRKNSLIDGWTPRAPITFFYSTADKTVPPYNSTNAIAAFTAKGCNVEAHAIPVLSHKLGCVSYFMWMLKRPELNVSN